MCKGGGMCGVVMLVCKGGVMCGVVHMCVCVEGADGGGGGGADGGKSVCMWGGG